MAQASRLVADSRREQMFPVLDPHEIERLSRFGNRKSYAEGEYLAKIGQVGPGMFIILSGEVEISSGSDLSEHLSIVTHGPGSFMAELSVLSGRPALVDGVAKSAVEALVIPTPRLRNLMIEEAELGENIMRAMILRRVSLIELGAGGPVIVGSAENADVLRLENFLSRNGHPHLRLDPAVDAGAECVIQRFHVAPADLPIVLCPNGQMLRNPSESELARCIGLVGALDPEKVYDVAIVGAGPAGLAAAVYAGSEGLSVLVLDCRAFGGQAGASARIENYLGFPTGISGLALMARAFNQAEKFGVDMAIPDEATRLRDGNDAIDGHFRLDIDRGESVMARSVIIATGARYRRLDVPNIEAFEGSSVHYWASPLEARLCTGREVALVGAGNSAGQAAVFLAGHVSKVWLLARGRTLDDSMSRYLVERIAAQPNIEVLVETEVVALEGQDGRLEAVHWRHRRTGDEARCEIRHLFLFIGAEPNTDWLSQSDIQLDDKGFIRTSENFSDGRRPLETSRAGIFAIGDVRSGSIKRVASAVGEGAQVVATIHDFLADTGGASKSIGKAERVQ